MAIDTITIEQFVTDNGISMMCAGVDRNPHMDEPSNMDHWKCTLSRSFEGTAVYHDRATAKPSKRTHTLRMTLTFSQGYGHRKKEPNVASVLSCLASDSASIENAAGFADWASDLGYSEDSRKAEKTYKACVHQAKRLKQFLGSSLYDRLLFHTEPL